jgi:hypothetical protein
MAGAECSSPGATAKASARCGRERSTTAAMRAADAPHPLAPFGAQDFSRPRPDSASSGPRAATTATRRRSSSRPSSRSPPRGSRRAYRQLTFRVPKRPNGPIHGHWRNWAGSRTVCKSPSASRDHFHAGGYPPMARASAARRLEVEPVLLKAGDRNCEGFRRAGAATRSSVTGSRTRVRCGCASPSATPGGRGRTRGCRGCPRRRARTRSPESSPGRPSR